MDIFSSSSSLFQQIFHLYRHVSSARNFSDRTGALSVLIMVEYFRFESWVQASGLVTKDAASGEPVVHEASLRRCILLAATANWATMDYAKVETTVLGIISEVYKCLEQLNKLRGKYAMDLMSDLPARSPDPSVNPPAPAPTGLGSADHLFRTPQVAAALSREESLRRNRSRTVGFFRKVTFGWSLSDDVSDKAKIEEALQRLRELNDRLEALLQPSSRGQSDGGEAMRRLVSLKALLVSDEPQELRGIGNAMMGASSRGNQGGGLYADIYAGAMLKAQRLEGDFSQSELEAVVLDSNDLAECVLPTSRKYDRTLTKLKSDGTPLLLEWTQYPSTLPSPSTDLLTSRIATLAALLHLAGTPYFNFLPRTLGYLRPTRTTFALAYLLPPAADPSRDPLPLYSLLPTTSRADLAPQGLTKRISRAALPTLQQRYLLARSLAHALLSLQTVSWLHKSLSSFNTLLFRTPHGAIDFAHPLLVGFGVSRREQPAEVTIDTRDPDSPLSLWAHPRLRRDAHVRFQRRYDIYSLGLVLFEIAMWQDLVSFADKGGEDLQTYVVNHAGIVAHRMGTGYRDAVLACLDEEGLWEDAERRGGGCLAEVFVERVVGELEGCLLGGGEVG